MNNEEIEQMKSYQAFVWGKNLDLLVTAITVVGSANVMNGLQAAGPQELIGYFWLAQKSGNI